MIVPEFMESLTRRWWLVALQGVAAIIFGLAAWVWPGITLGVLVALFGAYVLIDGILALASGASTRSWALILGGIAGIGAGIVTFFFPGITALALLAFIAAWAIMTGLLEIVAGIEFRRAITNEWLVILGGVLSVIFGLILVVHPGAGALAIVWLIGAYAVVIGIIELAFAFRLHGWHDQASHQVRREHGHAAV